MYRDGSRVARRLARRPRPPGRLRRARRQRRARGSARRRPPRPGCRPSLAHRRRCPRWPARRARWARAGRHGPPALATSSRGGGAARQPRGFRAAADGARREQARTAGAALLALGVGFEAILYSPKERALQTAELAAEGFDRETRELSRPCTAGRRLRRRARRSSERRAVGRRAAAARRPRAGPLDGRRQLTGARIDFKKGGVAVVRLEGAGGELLSLLRPRELALIASGAPSPPAGRLTTRPGAARVRPRI